MVARPKRLQSTLSALLVAVFVAALCSPALAAPLQIAPNAPFDAARDATGRLWGVLPESPHRLATYDGATWRAVNWTAPIGAEPQRLERRRNGALLCLWSRPNFHYELSEHRGQTSRLIARFKLDAFERSYIHPEFCDGGATIWLTAGGTDIYRIETNAAQADNAATRVYRVPAQWLRLNNDEPLAQTPLAPLKMHRDSGGRWWFWSDIWAFSEGSRLLNGVLLFDGRTWTHRLSFDGVPLIKSDKPGKAKAKPEPPEVWILALAQRDARHLWISVDEGGLFEIDVRNLRARRISEPYPKAFRYVQQVTALGADWYVVSGSKWHESDEDYSLRRGSLWRLRNGRWRLLIAGLDKADSDRRRALCRTEEGLWVGAVGGVWFVRGRDEKAFAVDWRCGFPIQYSSEIFAMGGRRVLALGNSEESVSIAAAAPLLWMRPPDAITTFRTYLDLVQDERGHLWSILSLRRRALSEWDGTRWRHHATPRGYQVSNAGELALDARGRVWIIPDSRDGPCPIFETSTRRWQTFANYRLALQTQRKGNGAWPLLERTPTRTGRGPIRLPRFDSRRRITYRNDNEHLYLFDGRAWHRWTLAQIIGPQQESQYFQGAPFFDRAGILCANISDQTWNWTSAGWKLGAFQPDPDQARRDDAPTHAGAPPACHIAEPDNSIRDRNGAIWIVEKRELFKARADLDFCTQLFPKKAQPFLDKRFFNTVWVDARGNAFFNTAYGYIEYVLIRTPGTPPDTRIRLTRRTEDSFAADFSTNAPASWLWFRWRLDKGPWSKPAPASHLELPMLPAGRHTLEVAAMNRDLQLDATPAQSTLAVHIDAQKQTTRWIALLRAPDYAQRDAAVNALARNPQVALPALREARANANADARWWIDAAIQQAEAAQSATQSTLGRPR